MSRPGYAKPRVYTSPGIRTANVAVTTLTEEELRSEELLVKSLSMEEILIDIKNELKQLNLHLASISGEDIKKEDL